MSNGLNRATLIGYLGDDPELRHTQSGTAMLKVRLATTESVRQDDGTFKEYTQWHNVVLWGKRAEALAKLLAKGKQIYVEGRIDTRSYDDKEGAKRYVTEINAQQVILLGGGRSAEAPPAPQKPTPQKPTWAGTPATATETDRDTEIPF